MEVSYIPHLWCSSWGTQQVCSHVQWLSSQAPSVNLSYPTFYYMIHLYRNQPNTLKSLVSEWYGIPRGDAGIYVRFTLVPDWLLGHTPKPHMPLWYTSVTNYNYRYRNLKIQRTVSILVIANLHHLKKKGWGEEGILGQNDKCLS